MQTASLGRQAYSGGGGGGGGHSVLQTPISSLYFFFKFSEQKYINICDLWSWGVQVCNC